MKFITPFWIAFILSSCSTPVFHSEQFPGEREIASKTNCNEAIGNFFKKEKIGKDGSITAPLVVESLPDAIGERLYLSCSVGKCLMDTGGGESLFTLDDFKKIKSKSKLTNRDISIPTLQGVFKFDEYEVDSFVIAGKEYQKFSILVSKDFPQSSSPLIGKNAILDQGLKLDFKNKQVGWHEGSMTSPDGKLFMINSWYCLKLKAGNELHFNAGFDTGAPITLIDKSIYDKNPKLFKNITIAPNQTMMAELASPLIVAGHELTDKRVIIVDFKSHIGKNSPDIFLGLNEIQSKVWKLDFKDLEFGLEDF